MDVHEVIDMANAPLTGVNACVFDAYGLPDLIEAR